MFRCRIGDRGTDLNGLAWPCWRKVRHASLADAEAHLRELLARPLHLRDPDTLCAYQCQHCGGYHTGHKKEEADGE